MTPLHMWNPYNIEYKEGRKGNSVTAGGRNGKLEPDMAYNGTRRQIFYRYITTLYILVLNLLLSLSLHLGLKPLSVIVITPRSYTSFCHCHYILVLNLFLSLSLHPGIKPLLSLSLHPGLKPPSVIVITSWS